MNHIRGICRSSARQRLSHGAAEPPASMVCYHTLLSLRELGCRAQFPGAQLERLDELIVPLVTARARRRGCCLAGQAAPRRRRGAGADPLSCYCSNASTISGSSFVTPLAVQVSIVESV